MNLSADAQFGARKESFVFAIFLKVKVNKTIDVPDQELDAATIGSKEILDFGSIGFEFPFDYPQLVADNILIALVFEGNKSALWRRFLDFGSATLDCAVLG